jgi:toxin ParE1/3/4
MQSVEVTYRPQALADLKEIYQFVLAASQHPVTANSFIARIMARCRRIGDAPNGGRLRDDLAKGLRTVPFERSAVIAYVVADTVEITNVFYGGRDYDALFGADDAGDE